MLPVLALLVFGIIDFGRMLNAQIQISVRPLERVFGSRRLPEAAAYSTADVIGACSAGSAQPRLWGTAGVSVSRSRHLSHVNAAATAAATVQVAYDFKGIFFFVRWHDPAAEGGHAMRRLNRRRRDRGAAALIVTILFAGGVLLGCAALTVDVGQLYSERRSAAERRGCCGLVPGAGLCQRRNMFVRRRERGCPCNNRISTAQQRRMRRTTQRRVQYGVQLTYDNGLCGRATTTAVSCAAPSGSLLDCPPLPSWLTANTAIPYVEVHNLTQTEARATASSRRPLVARSRVLRRGSVLVRSCRMGFAGGSGQGNIPITVSGCDWMHATGGTIGGGGGAYYPAPVYTERRVVTVYGYGGPASRRGRRSCRPARPGRGRRGHHARAEPARLARTQPTACPTWQGHAFRWLRRPRRPHGSYRHGQYPFDWMHTSTGNNVGCDLDIWLARSSTSRCSTAPPRTCMPGLHRCPARTAHGQRQQRLVPPSRLRGVLPQWLQRQRHQGLPNKHKSLVSNNFPCNGGDRCISGWFCHGTASGHYRGSAVRGRLLRHLHHPPCGLRSTDFEKSY